MIIFFVFKQKTVYDMRISDWSSDVCSSDLQVAEIGAGAQVVLPHQAVEVDRRGGAGVALVVQYLRHLVEHRGQLGEQRAGVFQRTTLGQVDHDLQLRLVVEGQHLHHHQLERSEEHTSELQSLMRISYAVFCLKKKTNIKTQTPIDRTN